MLGASNFKLWTFSCFLFLGGFQGCERKANERVELTKLGYSYHATNFIRCAEHGDVVAVRLFLKTGMDPNSVNYGSALVAAARAGQKEVVNVLLDGGADPNIFEPYETTPLMASAVAGRIDIAKKLIDRGAKVDAASQDGRTAFWLACANGNVGCAEFLGERGANINVQTKVGSALEFAKQQGYADVVRFLEARQK